MSGGLPADLEPSVIEAVLGELGELGARVGRPLSVVAHTRSTSDDARAAAAAGAPHGATFVADAQSAGRGRGNHVWHSPAGENLYLSMVLRPRLDPQAVAPVTLALGVAVVSVLEQRLAGTAAAGSLRLKWPNDVLAGGRKLAGILVEGQLRGGEVVSVVAGVGVNVRTTSFPGELAGRATSLALLGGHAEARGELAARLCAAMGHAVALFELRGLGPFLGELAARDALRGRTVEVGGVTGVAEGLDGDGRLLVRRDDGVLCPVVSGEVAVQG